VEQSKLVSDLVGQLARAWTRSFAVGQLVKQRPHDSRDLITVTAFVGFLELTVKAWQLADTPGRGLPAAFGHRRGSNIFAQCSELSLEAFLHSLASRRKSHWRGRFQKHKI
jgi:hypothetical protein